VHLKGKRWNAEMLKAEIKIDTSPLIPLPDRGGEGNQKQNYDTI
jgi:hypothetical protein